MLTAAASFFGEESPYRANLPYPAARVPAHHINILLWKHAAWRTSSALRQNTRTMCSLD